MLRRSRRGTATAVGGVLIAGLLVAGSASSASATEATPGIVDASFSTAIDPGATDGDPGDASSVFAVTVQPDGKILVGGIFTYFHGTQVGHLVRLNPDGTVDEAFSDRLDVGFEGGSVRSIALQNDGSIVVGGLFSTANGVPSLHLARLKSTGAVDVRFSQQLTNSGDNTGLVGGSVRAITIQNSDKIVVGGLFTTLNGADSNHLARFNSDGSPDTTFSSNLGTAPNNGLDGDVNAIAQDGSGNLLVGGDFANASGTPSIDLARFSVDGVFDSGFTSSMGSSFSGSPSPYVNTLLKQESGKIIIGGSFTGFDGNLTNNIVRLSSAGSYDSTFTTNVGSGFQTSATLSDVRSVIAMPDASLLVGGDFNLTNGVTTGQVARLSTDGLPDTNFTANMFGLTFLNTNTGEPQVFKLAAQPNGAAVIGGWFSSISGVASSGLARFAAPDSTPPISAMLTPTAQFQKSSSFGVSWSGTDPVVTGEVTSGVGQYAVRYRSATAGGALGDYIQWRPAIVSTSATFSGSPDTRYCFSSQAREATTGVAGAWSAEKCTTVPADDRALTRNKSTAWTRATPSGWIAGTSSQATVKGSYLITTSSRSVRTVGVVAWRCSTCGSVDVYVGSSKVGSISLKKSGAASRALVTLPRLSSLKTGKVKIVVSSAGKVVRLDGVAISGS